MSLRFLFRDMGDMGDHEPDDEADSRPERVERCTPEKLLAFIEETRKATGRSPTLKDCKDRFGGILGAIVCSWKLRDDGLI